MFHFGHVLSTKRENYLICQLRNGINAGMAGTLKYEQKFCEKIEKKIKVLFDDYNMEENFEYLLRIKDR